MLGAFLQVGQDACRVLRQERRSCESHCQSTSTARPAQHMTAQKIRLARAQQAQGWQQEPGLLGSRLKVCVLAAPYAEDQLPLIKGHSG